jgi:molybdate transport system substrate-binding protein
MPISTLTCRAALLISMLAVSSGCRSSVPAKQEVTVAAAANLTAVFEKLGPQFEAQTKIHPVFNFGSTAQLARQIESSAPFDVFAAADAEHVDDLARKGLLLPGSSAVYATGVLALWVPAGSKASVGRVDDVTMPEVKVIAVAKPELAPYGQATVESLRSLGIWDKVQSKIVYAENISIAKQYGVSNNADAVFTAYSLVVKEPGRVIPVEESLHAPITQKLGILAHSQHVEAAQRFVDFLVRGGGRDILSGFGYKVK